MVIPSPTDSVLTKRRPSSPPLVVFSAANRLAPVRNEWAGLHPSRIVRVAGVHPPHRPIHSPGPSPAPRRTKEPSEPTWIKNTVTTYRDCHHVRMRFRELQASVSGSQGSRPCRSTTRTPLCVRRFLRIFPTPTIERPSAATSHERLSPSLGSRDLRDPDQGLLDHTGCPTPQRRVQREGFRASGPAGRTWISRRLISVIKVAHWERRSCHRTR